MDISRTKLEKGFAGVGFLESMAYSGSSKLWSCIREAIGFGMSNRDKIQHKRVGNCMKLHRFFFQVRRSDRSRAYSEPRRGFGPFGETG